MALTGRDITRRLAEAIVELNSGTVGLSALAERLRALASDVEATREAQASLPGIQGAPSKDVALEQKVERIFAYWVKAAGKKKATLTDERKTAIRARLRRYSEEDVCRAILGCCTSDFHTEGGHTELTMILRNDTNVERFREKAEGARVSRSVSQEEHADRVARLEEEQLVALSEGRTADANRLADQVRALRAGAKAT